MVAGVGIEPHPKAQKANTKRHGLLQPQSSQSLWAVMICMRISKYAKS